jgi:predicted patatin/cPLA2 family phospholipase
MSTSIHFDAIGFAGGGNRCYWQSGFWEAFAGLHPQRPGYYVTVSAGAYHCAMNLTGKARQVREAAIAFAGERRPDFVWKNLISGRSPFVVGGLFDQFLTTMFDDGDLAILREAPPIFMQVSRPPPLMPSALAALGSIAAYQLEKRITGGAYSKAGRYLGLSPAWISTHEMQSVRDLIDGILATASVPPFMRVGRIHGRPCLDGGLVDNPPLLMLEGTEEDGGRTLLLTTRHGRVPPSSRNRTVVSPSEPITVNNFTIRDPDGLRRAYEIGLRDGERFARAQGA